MIEADGARIGMGGQGLVSGDRSGEPGPLVEEAHPPIEFPKFTERGLGHAPFSEGRDCESHELPGFIGGQGGPRG